MKLGLDRRHDRNVRGLHADGCRTRIRVAQISSSHFPKEETTCQRHRSQLRRRPSRSRVRGTHRELRGRLTPSRFEKYTAEDRIRLPDSRGFRTTSARLRIGVRHHWQGDVSFGRGRRDVRDRWRHWTCRPANQPSGSRPARRPTARVVGRRQLPRRAYASTRSTVASTGPTRVPPPSPSTNRWDGDATDGSGRGSPRPERREPESLVLDGRWSNLDPGLTSPDGYPWAVAFDRL